jgi:hypothetical protein
MEKFVGFAIGVAIFVAYIVVAGFIGVSVTNAVPDLSILCLLVVVLGWVAMSVVAIRREKQWIGYGIIAAPFLALLLVTVSCLVLLGVNNAA